MGTFTYNTGNPLDLAAGKAIDFSDLSNSFADIKTFLTGANLDATNLATSMFSPYRTVHAESVICDDSVTTSGTYYANIGSNVYFLKSGTASTWTPALVPLNSSDYTITGLTPKLRLSVGFAVNATAPACNFTVGLYSITSTTSSGFSFVTTVGSLVTGSSITRNTPSASTVYRDVSSDFSFPTAGNYLLGASISAGVAANSVTNIYYDLQMHWV